MVTDRILCVLCNVSEEAIVVHKLHVHVGTPREQPEGNVRAEPLILRIAALVEVAIGLLIP
jgi:hypothetical protein